MRLLKRVARDVEDEETRPKRAKIIELCTRHTLIDCTRSPNVSSDIDDWPGGYMFLYWIITGGPKWLRRIAKEELEVSFDVQKYSEAFLHVTTCHLCLLLVCKSILRHSCMLGHV